MDGYVRTAILLAGMTAFFLAVGQAMGGTQGAMIALVLALGMNIFSYWNSDKMVLRAYRAQPINAQDPQLQPLDEVVTRLAQNAQLPKPKAYIIENPQPNAFATGRNPEHAAVAVTTGLLERLSTDEVAGVIAHELAHIKNRDTLIMTITATISGAIGMLAKMGAMFGRGRSSVAGQQPQGGGGNPIMGILAMVLAPLAAMIVQMAISRTREYEADRVGAAICGKPHDLADALEKIAGLAPQLPNRAAERNPETAHLFIASPFIPAGLRKLFSTHPDPKERIRRLRAMREQLVPEDIDDHQGPWSSAA